jgi:predicted glycoside hydrolase/deacetylase ChbG (UPF0249 family)
VKAPPSGKFLIVTAEDYGLSPSVSRGILDSVRFGIVRNVSVLTNIVTDENLARLKELSAASVGLHFTLTAGSPVTPPEKVPSLVNADGSFYPRWERLQGRAHPDHISLELHAQYERLRRAGFRVCHLNSHHHIHIQPEVLDIFVRFARRRRLPMRASIPPLREVLNAAGIPTTQHYVGDYFDEPSITVDGLSRILRDLPYGFSELPCHPGLPDPELLKYSSYTYQRGVELATITNSEIQALLEKEGVILTSFCVLKSAHYRRRRPVPHAEKALS